MTDAKTAEAEVGLAWMQGAEEALEQAYARWSPLVHGLARKAVGPVDAEDVTQQVFLSAWRARTTYNPDHGPMGAWLVGITRRLVADVLRQRHRGSEVPSALEEDDHGVDLPWEDADRDDLLAIYEELERIGELLVAAAVGGLVTWGGLELSGVRDSGEDGSVVLATGGLSALTVDGTDGSVSVVEVGGQKRLRVQLSSPLDPEDGYLEVWLLRPDVSGLVTLGVLEGERADFPLPEGLDLSEYAVVDISREHLDGDPGHGGASLVRGQVG